MEIEDVEIPNRFKQERYNIRDIQDGVLRCTDLLYNKDSDKQRFQIRIDEERLASNP